MNEIMIRIDNVSKVYKLGQIGGTTLRDELQRKRARMLRKEDPTKIIGSKDYEFGETFMALNNVSFDVLKGERVGIIGHNGAGKSTLLKLISKVTAPSSGMIGLNGRVASMLEVGTGFHGELTGRENIYMNGAILGMTKKEIENKIDAIIEFSECRKFIDTPVKRYSSGMYVKLAFAVAAHLDSEIMIMDEVLAVGDMKFQKKCIDKMGDVSEQEGRTVLYVSHNMKTIRQLCTRCIVLDHGSIVYNGDVEKAIKMYSGSSPVSLKSVCFSNIQRPASCLDGIKITKIEILNRDKWSIKFGEKIQIRIYAKSTERLKNVGIRTKVTCYDNTAVTVLTAHNAISCEKNEDIVVSLEGDLSQLMPGLYYLSPALYKANEYGTSGYYDHLEQGITFEVLEPDGFNNNISWNRIFWGDVKFPDFRVL